MSSRVHHVCLSDVRFAYPGATRPTLDIESLTIDAGEHVALIGSSGAGKTTLLRLIDGRLTDWSGTVEVLQRPLSSKRPPPRQWRADIGFVFQDMALIDRLTVFDNVRNGRLGRTGAIPSLFGIFQAEDRTAIERAIDDVGLGGLAYQRVDQLSGGQMQRVGVARCLAQEPKILVADEPISNLDPASAEKTLGLLKDSAETRGATLMISSHQPSLVAGYVDRAVGLRDGRVVFDEPAAAMATDDLAELYGLKLAHPAA